MRVCIGDLEANGLLDTVTKIHCGVFKDIRTGEVFKFHPGSHADYISEMLKFLDSVGVLIMHNGIGYDWPLLEKLHNYTYKGKKVDTLIMSRLLNPKRTRPFTCPNKRAGPHSVESWGYRVGRGKPDHSDWTTYSPEMLHRCSEDVEIQHLIYEKLLEEMKESGGSWKQAFQLTHQLFQNIRKQEDYGWLVDQPYMQRNIDLLTKWIDKIAAAIQPRLPLVLEIKETKKDGEYNFVRKPFLKSGSYNQHVTSWIIDSNLNPDDRPVAGPFSRIDFRRVNIDSDKEVKEFLLSLGWQPKEWNTNDAGERTSAKMSKDDPFEGVQGSLGRLVSKRIICRQRRSIIEGWQKCIRPDGRIPQIITGLAATGRATHKNIVNVPGGGAWFGQQMRKMFICKPGFVIVGTDSAGCQNRMLAARVGDPFFTKTLIEGTKEDRTSIHWVNVAALDKFGIKVDYKLAKNLNYGFMFGASDNKLGSMVGGNKDTGGVVREALLSVSAGFGALVADITAQWRKTAKRKMGKWGRLEYSDGYIIGLDGRPIYIESEHAILVYLLQSDEAIMMAAAYCFLFKRAEKRGWKFGVDWGMLAWVHDEYQCEVREDIAEEFSKVAEQCIVDAGKFYNIQCPHAGESDIGINWGETH